MKRPLDTALWDAVVGGHILAVRSLLGMRADVDTVGDNGLTLFMAASQRGELDMMQRLFSYRANIDAVNAKGRNALSFATNPSYGSEPHAGAIMFLLESRADVDKKDLRGLSPLIRAVCEGDLGGDGGSGAGLAAPVAACSNEGVGGSAMLTPLERLYGAAEDGDFARVVDVLEGDGPFDVDAVDRSRGVYWPPLVKAAENGSVEIVNALLLYRANVAVRTPRGRSALSFAACPSRGGSRGGDRDAVIEALLANGADPSAEEKPGVRAACKRVRPV